MSIFLIKAQENFSSAEILISNAYFNSSIHCLYYSFFQHLLYLEESNAEKKLSVNIKEENSHSIRITKTRNYISSLSDESKMKAIKFDAEAKYLKNIRKNADYSDIEISEKISKECQRITQRLNKLLVEICNER